ncbi:hypothetical protein HPB49_013287 [Dermacentor silvarum]|uniref:Uncharacterized protein n=1 Tax=Dermacentor silvarum TaxID=543639 RepID=A0ACB8CRA6_DERSI|nr:hypothetical protein HPB49_013287 [Dermacentor silvarum]
MSSSDTQATNRTWELSLYELNRTPQEVITDSTEIAVSPRSLHSELMCPICLDMLKNTMTTKECLHRFVRSASSRRCAAATRWVKTLAVPRARERLPAARTPAFAACLTPHQRPPRRAHSRVVCCKQSTVCAQLRAKIAPPALGDPADGICAIPLRNVRDTPTKAAALEIGMVASNRGFLSLLRNCRTMLRMRRP